VARTPSNQRERLIDDGMDRGYLRRLHMLKRLTCCLFLSFSLGLLSATRAAAQAAAPPGQPDDVKVTYGASGLEVATSDGRFRVWFGLRGQFRFSTPFDDDPASIADFDAPADTALVINRARLKIGGHAYRHIDYYTEYEIKNQRMLDLRFTVTRFEAATFRIGQWKPEYNRERRDSSGEQQFVDRSIVNRTFTIDRQNGVMLAGHLWKGWRAESRYFAAVLNGEGLGDFDDGGERPMTMFRWQWNFLGRDLEFSQSDTERSKVPAASVAVATVRNRSRFTRFSSQGGGELDGFPADVAERYDVTQSMVDGAYKYLGGSFQGEFHWKAIEDRVAGGTTRLRGMYVQAGYFPHERWPSIPTPLELAARYAFVDPDTRADADRQTEITFAGNWFFVGHRNKLTVDTSRIGLQAPTGARARWRLRIQWDIQI
jgi:phosphate-selective porin